MGNRKTGFRVEYTKPHKKNHDYFCGFKVLYNIALLLFWLFMFFAVLSGVYLLV